MKALQKIIAAAAICMLAGCGSTSSGSMKSAAASNFSGIASTAEYAAENYALAAGSQPDITGTGETDVKLTGDKLVYTGSISLETLDYAETVSAVRDRIRQYKGIIESESENSGNYYWYQDDANANDDMRLSMTVRIPTESYEIFLNAMDGAGHVVSKSSNVDNISRQYNDNSIEIAALEKQQARLLEMLDEAQSVEDMVAIESRLSEIETQLNQKKSYQAQMDTDVEYSTVSIDIAEVSRYTPTEERPLGNFGKRFADGVKAGWHDFVWFLQELVIFLAGHVPHIGLVALVLAGFRKWKAKKKEKAEREKAKAIQG